MCNQIRILSKQLALAALCFSLSCCATAGSNQDFDATVKKAALAGNSGFNGVWNVTLKTRRDGCKLGIKTLPITAAIAQDGSKAAVTFEGSKSYKGNVTDKTLAASGTYKSRSSSGLRRYTGSFKAVLAGRRAINITNASLSMKQGGKACRVTFKGSGRK